MTEKKSKTKPAVLFICGNENSRKSQLESLKSYCDTHNLDIIKTFECERKNLTYRNTFDEMVKYVKSNHTKIAVVTYDVSKLQVGFEQSVCLNDLRNKKGSEIHFYKEDLIINRNSSAMDIARWDCAILANKIYVGLLKDNIRKSFSPKRANHLKNQ